MEFGLGRKRFIQGLVAFGAIGAAAALLGLIGLLLDGGAASGPSAARKAAVLALLLVMPPSLWLVLVAVLGSITLRLTERHVEQVLWRRFVLRRLPVAELTKVRGGGVSAMVLHFRGRHTIALPMIHAADRFHLLAALDRLRPDLRLIDRD